jgi:V8-like Glu-specific endopeptidase
MAVKKRGAKKGSKSGSKSGRTDAARLRASLQELTGEERAGLFPPHIDKVRELTSLELRADDEDTYAALLESICGATDDSQPVEQYDGSLGVTVAFVDNNQGAVGQLQWNNNLASIYTNPGTVNNVRWCTGTMISNDLFLTAGHCFDQTGGGWIRPLDNVTGTTISSAEIATNMHVNFNYQVDPSGVLRTEQSFPITQLVEYRLGGLDFAIVRLGGNPGSIWGTTPVGTTDAAVGDMLCIIGHPAGWPKRIEAGPCTSLSGNFILYNDIDTLGGNSGSGILRANDGRIVGVHTNGGCNAAGTGSNLGVRITSVIAASPTLQSLPAPGRKPLLDTIPSSDITLAFLDRGTAKFLDDIPTRPWLDVRGSFKSFDDLKGTGLDKMFGDRKMPGLDGAFDPGRWGQPGPFSRPQAVPFVLSTPHHTMEWVGGAGGAGGASEASAQYEQALAQIEAAIQQLAGQLQALDQEYLRILAEYEQVMSGRM